MPFWLKDKTSRGEIALVYINFSHPRALWPPPISRCGDKKDISVGPVQLVTPGREISSPGSRCTSGTRYAQLEF